MNRPTGGPFHAILAGVVIVCSWSAGRAVAQPPVVDVVGNMSSSQFASLIAPQSYKDWGNEPFVAVNPTDPNKIVVSGFAYGTSSTTQSASIWYSTNGGSSWTMTFPFQAPGNGISIPHDQTFTYDSSGNLHAVMLGTQSGSDNLYHGITSNPAATGSTTWTSGTVNKFGAGNADQPFMALSGQHIYVGYDDFTSGGKVRVARSDNNGTTFTAANDLPISTASPSNSFTNPGTRVATDSNGNAYAIFGIGSSSSNGVQNVNYHLNSYHIGSSGASWDDTATNGIFIDSGSSHQIDSTGKTWFGGVNELRGNITSIASDPAGDHIYVVYGKINNGVDQLFMEEYHPGPGNSLIGSGSVEFSVAGQRTALPSVAVTSDGTVYTEYDSYVGPNNDPLALGGTFQLHLTVSHDQGQTFTDQVLYSWTAPAAPNNPNYGGNRELGDYQYLTAMGNTVSGTFAARGNVNSGGINDTAMIVPFYFTVSAVPEPATFWLLTIGGGLAWGWRRRR